MECLWKWNKTQIRRTVFRSKGGERKQTTEVSLTRLKPEEGVSETFANACPASGLTTLVSTGMIDGLPGFCLAQHGCCAPQGIAVKLIATNRTGATFPRDRGQQE
jgi:hypothetical protein